MTILHQTDKTKLLSKEAVWLIQTVADSFYEIQIADIISEEAS
jgi:hypothetical protein